MSWLWAAAKALGRAILGEAAGRFASRLVDTLMALIRGPAGRPA